MKKLHLLALTMLFSTGLMVQASSFFGFSKKIANPTPLNASTVVIPLSAARIDAQTATIRIDNTLDLAGLASTVMYELIKKLNNDASQVVARNITRDSMGNTFNDYISLIDHSNRELQRLVK